MDLSDLPGWISLPGSLTPLGLLIIYLGREATRARKAETAARAAEDVARGELKKQGIEHEAELKGLKEDRSTRLKEAYDDRDKERERRFDAEERAERAEARVAGLEERIKHLEDKVKRLHDLIAGGGSSGTSTT